MCAIGRVEYCCTGSSIVVNFRPSCSRSWKCTNEVVASSSLDVVNCFSPSHRGVQKEPLLGFIFHYIAHQIVFKIHWQASRYYFTCPDELF